LEKSSLVKTSSKKRPGGTAKSRRAILKVQRHGRHTARGKGSTIEYVALLLQPKVLKHGDDYTFIIFICLNCPGAHEVSTCECFARKLSSVKRLREWLTIGPVNIPQDMLEDMMGALAVVSLNVFLAL
jgi:hypothetical protein